MISFKLPLGRVRPYVYLGTVRRRAGLCNVSLKKSLFVKQFLDFGTENKAENILKLDSPKNSADFCSTTIL